MGVPSHPLSTTCSRHDDAAFRARSPCGNPGRAHRRTHLIKPGVSLMYLGLHVRHKPVVLATARPLHVPWRPVFTNKHPSAHAILAIAVERTTPNTLGVLPHQLCEMPRRLAEARLRAGEIILGSLVSPRVHGGRDVGIAPRQVFTVSLGPVRVRPDALRGIVLGVRGEGGIPGDVRSVVLEAVEIGGVEERGAKGLRVGVLAAGRRGRRCEVGGDGGGWEGGRGCDRLGLEVGGGKCEEEN